MDLHTEAAAVTANPPIENEYDLQDEWGKAYKLACESFIKTTGADLTKSNLSPVEVLYQIKAKQDKDEADSAKFKVAKEILGKSVESIQRLGSALAQGAGMVFGPSQLCLNALTYLIVAGQNYRSIFSSLTDLFSRISDVLERFVIYLRMKDLVDPSLRGIIHQLLLSFVRICELSVKVLHGNKALKFLKVLLFNGDDGIKAELEKLKVLAERESQMKGTLILESVKTSEGNVVSGFAATKEGFREVLDKVDDSDKKREANQVAKKQRDTIQQALGGRKLIDERKLMYEETHQSLKRTIVKNTGKWLQQDTSFIRWADRQKDSESILCISGNEGYGKSYLVYTVIQALRNRYIHGQEDPSRTSIAYCYFKKGAQSLEDCLKALAWQIVLNDPVYQKDLANSCKGLEDVTDVEELWNRLFANFSATDATFFILLDGINSIDVKYRKDWWQLLKNLQGRPNNKGSLRIRLLLSTRVDKLEEIRYNLESSVLTVDLASKNRDDIQIFIKDKLDKMNILSDTSKEVQNLRDEIFTSLTEDAHGDFVNVDLLLKEISGMQRPAEVRAVLAKAKASDGRTDTIDREIQRCNKLLKDRDIQDLNELLTWVICADRALTLGELEAVLYLKNRESSLGLRNQIRDQYSAFFHISGVLEESDATVTLVSDSIKDYFQKPPIATGIENLTADGNVHELEVKIIKKFLESVCDAELFAKFGFEEFFKRKLNRNATFIAVDLENPHLKILTDCLQLISGDDCEETKPLFGYALEHFAEHLMIASLSSVDPIKKAEVGKRLLEVFTKNEYIKNWWTGESYWLRFPWFYEDKYVEAVLDWFKDPAAIKQVPDKDKEWIKGLTSNSNPDLDLLESIIEFLASEWLRHLERGSPEGATRIFFSCVHGYINKIKHRKDPHCVRLSYDVEPVDIESSAIHEVGDFVAKQLGVIGPDYEWEVSLATIFRVYEKPEDAIRLFKAASTMISDPWKANYGLALTYGGQEKWQLAIQTLEPVGNAILDGDTKDNDLELRAHDILRDLARFYEKNGEDETAMKVYQKILKDCPDNYTTVLDVLKLQTRQGMFTEVIDFLQEMKLHRDETTGLDRLTQIYHKLAFDDDYHSTILKAATKVNRLNHIKEGYQTAVDAAKKKPAQSQRERTSMLDVQSRLLYHFALALFTQDIDANGRTQAIDLWEQVLKLSRNLSGKDAPYLAAKKLCLVYFERAKEAPPDSKLAIENVNKLSRLSEVLNENRTLYYSTVDPKLLLGRYYRLIGREENARDVLRGHFKIALDLLSDEDPSNDYQGYQRLAETLTHFSDDKNALAAWSLLLPGEDSPETGKAGEGNARDGELGEAPQKPDGQVAADSQAGSLKTKPEDLTGEDQPPTNVVTTSGSEEPGTTSSAPDTVHSGSLISPALEGPYYYCDGGECGVRWTFTDEMYVCKDCLDVIFCPSCRELLGEAEQDFVVCNPKHEFLHVPKYDAEEAKRVGKMNVRVGEQIMPISEWLDGIRREWGLSIDKAE